MSAAIATLSRTARLLSLLRDKDADRLHARATDETLAEARALGPALATETVSSILDAYEPRGEHAIAERAAHVAGELRLTGAVPALVRCADRLEETDVVLHASLDALRRMPVEATGPLLAIFERCTTADAREINAPILLAGVRDGRVCKALCGILGESPITAAECLGAHGDRAALPALGSALDGLEPLAPGAEGELRRCDEIIAIVQAIRKLRGAVSKERRAKFEAAWARSCELWGMGGPEVDRVMRP